MPVDLITRGVTELEVTVVTYFDKGVNNAAMIMSDVLSICGRESSDSAENVVFYPDSDFKLVELKKGTDGIAFEGVATFEHRIENKWFVRGFAVRYEDFLNDKLGRYKQVFRNAGISVGLHPSQTMEGILKNAETLLCYDGKPLISTTHPKDPKAAAAGSNIQANKLVKAAGLTFTTFQEALAAGRAFVYSDGSPVGFKPTHLVCGPKNEGMAVDICQMATPSGLQGGQNPWKGLNIQPLVIDALDSLDDGYSWFLVDARIEGEMPLILQERQPLELVPIQTDPSDPRVRESRQMRWLVDGSVVGGTGEPRRILKVTKS